MSGRAGYDLGQDIGKMMEHKFQTKLAATIAKIGHILGILLLAGGLLVLIADTNLELFDGELALPSFLVSLGGVALLLILHWIALQIDKKHRKEP